MNYIKRNLKIINANYNIEFLLKKTFEPTTKEVKKYEWCKNKLTLGLWW